MEMLNKATISLRRPQKRRGAVRSIAESTQGLGRRQTWMPKKTKIPNRRDRHPKKHKTAPE